MLTLQSTLLSMELGLKSWNYVKLSVL